LVTSDLLRLDKDVNNQSKWGPSKQSTFDDAKVYVANMNPDETKESMLEHFSKYGKIVCTRILYRHAKTSNGFVEFFDVESAKKTLETRVQEMNGRRVFVEKMRSRTYNNRNHLASKSSKTNRFSPY
jgi:RNA recognition motif-containing protein